MAAGEVLVTFQNRYPMLEDESNLEALLGSDRTAEHFKQAFTLKINSDNIPADSAQEIPARRREFQENTKRSILGRISSLHSPVPGGRMPALNVRQNA